MENRPKTYQIIRRFKNYPDCDIKRSILCCKEIIKSKLVNKVTKVSNLGDLFNLTKIMLTEF